MTMDPRDVLATRAAQAPAPGMQRGSSSFFTLVCSACGAEKPDEGFCRDRNRPQRRGRSHRCRECAAKNSAAWREKNLVRSQNNVRVWRKANAPKMAEMRRRVRLKAQYGLTPAQYDDMLAAQDGRCAICSEVCSTLVVDHDHTSGQVRALLCMQCNTGIGMLGDDVERVRQALKYLEEHRGSP